MEKPSDESQGGNSEKTHPTLDELGSSCYRDDEGFCFQVKDLTEELIKSLHNSGGLRTRATGKEQVQLWVQTFNRMTKFTFRLGRSHCTHSKSWKLVYKADFLCQHHKYESYQSHRDTVKKFGCPASMHILVQQSHTLSQKEIARLGPGVESFLCTVRVRGSHSHSVDDVLRFRAVSDATRESILVLYGQNYTPSCALDVYKYDLRRRLGEEKYDEVKVDRAVVPDLAYCYRLYYKTFGKRTRKRKSEHYVIKKMDCPATAVDARPTSLNTTHDANKRTDGENTGTTDGAPKKRRSCNRATNHEEFMLSVTTGELQPIRAHDVEIPATVCIVCARARKFFGEEVQLAECTQPYGGQLWEAASAKEDDVMLSRIELRGRHGDSILYHCTCYRFYVRVLDQPEAAQTRLPPTTAEAVNSDDTAVPATGQLDDNARVSDISPGSFQSTPLVSYAYKEFLRIVSDAIVTDRQPMLLSQLTQIFTDTVGRTDGLDTSVYVCKPDRLRRRLRDSFPTMHCHRVDCELMETPEYIVFNTGQDNVQCPGCNR